MIGHEELVRLLEARADPSVRHWTGVDASELAERGWHTATEKLLAITLCTAHHLLMFTTLESTKFIHAMGDWASLQ